MSPDFVYLASGSPRRRELLQQIGVSFRVLGAAVDETVLGRRGACGLRLAARRGQGRRGVATQPRRAPTLRCWRRIPRWCSMAAILGKPADRDDAERMLRQLSGRTHEVLTAVALRTGDGLRVQVSRSEVTFRRDRRRRSRAPTGKPESRATRPVPMPFKAAQPFSSRICAAATPA